MGVTGGAKFVARLRRAGRVGKVMDIWANDSAEIVAQEARDLLNDGGIPSPNHIVSRPGQPANTDSGYLASRTNAEDLPEQGHAAAISDAEYSLWIEMGTSRVVERPFMRPATANKRKGIVKAARDAVNRATK